MSYPLLEYPSACSYRLGLETGVMPNGRTEGMTTLDDGCDGIT